MKEYKVVVLKLGLTKRAQKLEETLNKYAREGWIFKHMDQHAYSIVLERDKNR